MPCPAPPSIAEVKIIHARILRDIQNNQKENKNNTQSLSSDRESVDRAIVRSSLDNVSNVIIYECRALLGVLTKLQTEVTMDEVVDDPAARQNRRAVVHEVTSMGNVIALREQASADIMNSMSGRLRLRA
eukprot:Tbor_TRINITY_DN5092_c0_g1::TRINITY_DN5092_c0_g1_i1::g.14354::m.14354